jgi:hypothetical protein
MKGEDDTTVMKENSPKVLLEQWVWQNAGGRSKLWQQYLLQHRFRQMNINQQLKFN